MVIEPDRLVERGARSPSGTRTQTPAERGALAKLEYALEAAGDVYSTDPLNLEAVDSEKTVTSSSQSSLGLQVPSRRSTSNRGIYLSYFH